MTFIYSRSKVRDRKLLEKARKLQSNLLCVDIAHEKLSASHFASLTSPGKTRVKDLLDPRIVEGYKIKNAEEAISLINNKPQLLKTPVVVTRQKVRYIKDLSDLQRVVQRVNTESEI